MLRHLLFLLLGMAVAARAGADTKIAILADKRLAAVGDLLTAELSGKPGLQLVERAELERVMKEQALAGAVSVEGALKLGRLVGADGCLFIAPIVVDMQKVAEAQLVAIRPAIVVDSLRLPGTAADAGEVSATLASWIETLLPKLNVDPRDAVRVSFLGIHAPVAGPKTEELERQLGLLFVHRMAHEPSWFVLERRRLDVAADEVALARETNAFWTGSFLLDGSLQEGPASNHLALTLSLKQPDGRVVAAPRVEGSATALVSLMEEAAARLVETVAHAPPAGAWNPAEEAAVFFKRGIWALQANIFREASEAAEASWALGNQSDDCWQLRVRTTTLLAIPETFADRFFRMDAIDARTIGASIGHARRSLELYADGVRAGRRPGGWEHLGIGAIRAASKTLKAAHLARQTRTREGEIADLRAAVRDGAHLLRESVDGGPPYELEELMYLYATYWCETPEDTIKVYRAMAWRFPSLFLSYRGFGDDELIAWNPADAPRLDVLWKEFCEELAKSNYLQQRLLGLLLLGGGLSQREATPELR
ncbi:MAG TPA: hypothetical protein VIH35_05925, partial [Kiritimatiellia bacterium]